jgi:hypothetical protein
MIKIFSKNLCFINSKRNRGFTGGLCVFIASVFVAKPSYSSCTSTDFVDYSHKDTFDRPWRASLETQNLGSSVLHFGNQFYSEYYYFKRGGAIYRVKTCGIKCNPKHSIVKEFSAKGKCEITKLNGGKFDLSCIAIDKKGKKHSNGLDNAIKDKKKLSCYELN